MYSNVTTGRSARQPEIKGHGQGLYYARTVILAHRGEIGIESEEGKGTTVIVTLAREAHIKKKYK